MTVVYFDYRPGDKVRIKQPNIDGMVMRCNFNGDGQITYEVQYWNDEVPLEYLAYSWELQLVETFEEVRGEK